MLSGYKIYLIDSTNNLVHNKFTGLIRVDCIICVVQVGIPYFLDKR